MKKLILSFAVLAFLSVPASTNADAPAAKTDVCHVNSANGAFEPVPGMGVFVFGRAISVNERALDAHLAHGDSDSFFLVDAEDRDLFEVDFGISLPNADCLFIV